MSHWVKGDVITAAKLNSMENRTATDVVYWINDNDGTLDKNYEEIEAAFLSGMLPVIKYSNVETGFEITLVTNIYYDNEDNLYVVGAFNGASYISNSSTGALAAQGIL